MTQTVRIIELLADGKAVIEMKRQSACHGDCESCGAGCALSGGLIRAVADNIVRAEKGDRVIVQSRSSKILGLAALIYLLPIVLFFLLYIAGTLISGEQLAVILGVFGFAAGISAACLKSRRLKMKNEVSFEIIALAQPDNDNPTCSDM